MTVATVDVPTGFRPPIRRLARAELRLLLRDPVSMFVGVALPTLVLLVAGAIPKLRTPDPVFGGVRFIDFFAPVLLAISIALFGLQTLPIGLSTYRERGILRRFATTPMRPSALLVVQLALTIGTAAVATAILVIVSWLVLDVPLPHHPVAFVLAFTLGTSAVFALGLLIAATAPRSRTAAGIGTVAFVLTQFFGGVYLPKFLLPEILVRVGEFVPPATGTLQGAWTGDDPQWLQMGVMAAIAVVAAGLAVKLFRWE